MRLDRVLLCALGGVLAAAAGCTPPAAVRLPQEAPVVAPPRVRDLLEQPWTVMRPPGGSANSMRLTSELVSRVDSVERRDSTTTILSATWTRLAGTEPPRLSGLLTDYRIANPGADPSPPAGLTMPLPFSVIEGRGTAPAQLQSPASGVCGVAAAVLQPLHELFVSTPPGLVAGASWSDSASYSICRDSILLAVQSVRAYRVIGAERGADGPVLLIDRTSTVTLRGDGVQFGEPLAITAEGTGTMRLALDLHSGAVVSASGESELRMAMRGRRRSQDLTQHTRIEISSP